MKAAHAFIALIVLVGCGPAETPSPVRTARPQRIVSLDYCADQFVLKLADRDQIVAVSVDATREFSYMRDAAQQVRKVRPRVEDALALSPDLVVRSYGGGPRVSALLERAGVPVAQIGYAEDFDGVRAAVREMAHAMGQEPRGEALIAELDARLRRIAQADRTPGRRALYTTPGGVTTGEGSLIHEIILAAGLSNFETTPGWRPLPLERLASEQPDIIAAGLFGVSRYNPDRWSAARHPVMARTLRAGADVPIEGAWTACGGWFVVEAVEALAEGPNRLEVRR